MSSSCYARFEAHTDDLTGLPNRHHLTRRPSVPWRPGRRRCCSSTSTTSRRSTTRSGTMRGRSPLPGRRRLAGLMPAGGRLGRLGGDEFVALLEGEHTEQSAMQTAQRMREALEEPFTIEGFRAPMPASIGIALAPTHAVSRAELLRCADVAMYRAKTHDSVIEVYLPEDDAHSRDRLMIVSELRAGLDGDELELQLPAQGVARRRSPGGRRGPRAMATSATRPARTRPLRLTRRAARADPRPRPRRPRWSARTAARVARCGPRDPDRRQPPTVNLLDTRLPADIAELLTRHAAARQPARARDHRGHPHA